MTEVRGYSHEDLTEWVRIVARDTVRDILADHTYFGDTKIHDLADRTGDAAKHNFDRLLARHEAPEPVAPPAVDETTRGEISGPMGKLYTTTPCHAQRAVFADNNAPGQERHCKIDGRVWEVVDVIHDPEDVAGDHLVVCWVEID